MSETRFQFSVTTNNYALSLLLISFFLLAVHAGLYLYNYQVEELPWLLLQLFDLDEENNLPTWFSSFVLLNNAFVLYLISKDDSVSHKNHWRTLAGGFLLLSIDEVAGLHETFNSAVEVNWALPAGVMVLFIAAAFIPFLLSLPRRQSLLYILSGFIYISGVIVIEILSEDLESDSLRYTLAVLVEEGFEMLGALLFLAVNLRLLSRSDNVAVTIKAN